MTRRAGGVALVLVLVAAAVVLVWPRPDKVRISADFVSSVGVYQGSEVRLMGVPIGTVDKLTPDGDHVRIEMSYDPQYRLAANAGAVIISPSIVADRFVQLTGLAPDGQKALASGAEIPLARTSVPVELDRVYRTAHDLFDALGPQGANDSGAVNRVLGVGARALDGNGAALHRMITGLAGATGTLGDSSDDFFASVSALEKLTGTLAADDTDVRTFNRQMADVVGYLADERGSLGALLDSLASAFGRVQTFVAENRAVLVSNVAGLRDVTGALVHERKALEEIIRVIPVGLDNLNRTWDARLQAARTRSNEAEIIKNARRFICDQLAASGIPQSTAVCNALLSALGGKR